MRPETHSSVADSDLESLGQRDLEAVIFAALRYDLGPSSLDSAFWTAAT
jgi:hypothetical protein